MPNHSNLGTFTALYSSPRTSHRKNFPPVEYRDLNCADISLLAAILAVEAPTEANTPNQVPPLKSQISQLPSHLQATIPRLSTFCRHHRNLTSLPLISLWNAIRDEVLSELATVWTNVNVSLAHAHFIDRIRNFSGFDPHQISRRCCAACSLARMAGDNDLLIAVGAMVLAGLGRRNWGRSKRVLFLQGLLGGRLSAAVAARHAEGPVVKMEQLAAEWRGIRRCFWESRRGGAVGPGEVVRDGPPQRPARDARQEGHVAVVLSCVGDDEGSAGPAHYPEHSGAHRNGTWKVGETSQSRIMSKPPAVPAKLTPYPSPYPSRQEDLPTNPGASSSVYSVDEAEDATSFDAGPPALPTSAPAPAARTHSPSPSSPRKTPPSICGESAIINLYRHSIFPPSPATSSCSSSVHPPANQETQHVEPPKPRHSLAPIWIPRPHYYYGGGSGEVEGEGDEEPAPVTSALWRRRTGRFNIPHSPARFGVGSGKGVEGSEDYDAEKGDVREEHVVVGAKADACWVPGMVGGGWI
ncbi:hypothetical protein KC330_g4963 [Hortaea werneckii]|nr:hypothetical protein KC330_g4963 [Hortaea werneckii]